MRVVLVVLRRRCARKALLALARTIEQKQGATDFFREVDVLAWTRNMTSKIDLDLTDSLPSLINNVIGWFDEISDSAHSPAATLKEIKPKKWKMPWNGDVTTS
jgi:hypothetical protein